MLKSYGKARKLAVAQTERSFLYNASFPRLIVSTVPADVSQFKCSSPSLHPSRLTIVDHLAGGKVSSQNWHGKANTLQEFLEVLRDALAALFIEAALFERSEFAVSMNAFSRQVIL